jgi:hypothetical protein
VFLICRYGHSDPMFRSPYFDPSSVFFMSSVFFLNLSSLSSCHVATFLSSRFHLIIQFHVRLRLAVSIFFTLLDLKFTLLYYCLRYHLCYSCFLVHIFPLSRYFLPLIFSLQLFVFFFNFLSSPCLSRQHARRSGLRSSEEARHFFQIVQVPSGAH